VHLGDRDDVYAAEHEAVTLVVDGRTVLLALGDVGVIGVEYAFFLRKRRKLHNKSWKTACYYQRS
jgi:hypothetical protein